MGFRRMSIIFSRSGNSLRQIGCDTQIFPIRNINSSTTQRQMLQRDAIASTNTPGRMARVTVPVEWSGWKLVLGVSRNVIART